MQNYLCPHFNHASLLIFVLLKVMLDVGFVNLVSVIAQNPKVTAINSCIEVDLTGQIVSDSIGTRMYSGNRHKICEERE